MQKSVTKVLFSFPSISSPEVSNLSENFRPSPDLKPDAYITQSYDPVGFVNPIGIFESGLVAFALIY